MTAEPEDEFDDDSEEGPETSGDECPFCDHFNSAPADHLCEHNCVFVWDGMQEALGPCKALEVALSELAELVSSANDDPAIEDFLQAERRKRTNEALIKAVSGDFNLVEALKALANAQSGSGWSTGGMLSGSGYQIYVPIPQRLATLTKECQALIKTCSTKSNGGS